MRALFATLLLAACAVEPDPEAEDLDLALRAPPRTGGCGDIVLYGANAADTQAVFVNLPALASQAHVAGTTLTGRITLPASNASVRAELGTDLTSATCVGAFPWPGPSVRRDLQGVAGTLLYRVTPDPSGSPSLPIATAEVRLIDLELVDSAGRGLLVPRVDFPPTTVGLYPP